MRGQCDGRSQFPARFNGTGNAALFVMQTPGARCRGSLATGMEWTETPAVAITDLLMFVRLSYVSMSFSFSVPVPVPLSLSSTPCHVPSCCAVRG